MNKILLLVPLFFCTILSAGKVPGGQIAGQERSTITSLPWSRFEVEEISKIFDGKSYFGTDAAEDVFKNYAAGYGIIHLATHAVLNDEHPSYSKLIFNSLDDKDDGLLYTYELYNLQLNAKLAVLSSCQTGTGRLVNGEGMFSIARAFMYAGVPSIIMSLWDIDDRSTAEIVVDFYKRLNNGENKTNALRNAKLTYLKNSDQLTANPVYWAGLISLGNQDKLVHEQNETGYWLYLLPVLTIPFFLFRRKIPALIRRKTY